MYSSPSRRESSSRFHHAYESASGSSGGGSGVGVGDGDGSGVGEGEGVNPGGGSRSASKSRRPVAVFLHMAFRYIPGSVGTPVPAGRNRTFIPV